MSTQDLSYKITEMLEEGNATPETVNMAFNNGKKLARESGIGIAAFYGLWDSAVNDYITRHKGEV